MWQSMTLRPRRRARSFFEDELDSHPRTRRMKTSERTDSLGERDSAEMQDELVGGQTSIQSTPCSSFQVIQ